MKKYLLLTVMIFIGGLLFARQDDPGLPGGDPDVPLDGGLSLLICAGAVYGVKKIRQQGRGQKN